MTEHESEHEAEGDIAAVLAANRAFYEAFEARDIHAMSAVWEQSERAVCTHPGWATLRGWPAIQASWSGILAGTPLQFIITAEHVVLGADLAVVTNDENLISGASSGTVAGLNVFSRGGDGIWRLVAHHGSSVARS